MRAPEQDHLGILPKMRKEGDRAMHASVELDRRAGGRVGDPRARSDQIEVLAEEQRGFGIVVARRDA